MLRSASVRECVSPAGPRWVRFVAGFLAAAWAVAAPAQAKPGYLRYPDICGDRIVFTAEGDLWTATLGGRDVRRLTSHPGEELHARFSPDGRWIAFAGDYDGNRDLFVMPAEGGEPRRLTWHPAPDDPLGWTPDGEQIIFRSTRVNPHGIWEIFTINAAGGDPQQLPIGRAVSLAIDAQTGQWAFNRTEGGGTWKRYRGGTAADIWVGSPERADFRKVTEFPGADVYPMWFKGRIYFLSDQGGTMNIWSMLPDGSDRLRHTALGPWDAGSPSIDSSGRIVFTLAGDIHLFDPANGSERAIVIDLPSERTLTRTRYPDPARYITSYALAPQGDRLAVVARGEIFSVPVDEGITLPITRGSGSREDRVAFDPKGKRVVYVTDASGEEAIVTADAWGRGETRTVTPSDEGGWHFPPAFSSDGKWIAYGDQTHTLYVISADGGQPRRVDHSDQAEIREYAWSPDGRWLAYVKRNSIDFGSVFIYDTQEGSLHQVSGWTTDDRTPAWDPEGRFLYFLSDRTMNPMLDVVDFETIVIEPTRLYLLLLRPDVENPFLAREGAPPKAGEEDQEAAGDDDKQGDADKKDKSESAAPKPVEIAFEGLADRIVELPVEAGRYYGLAATKGKLFYLSWPAEGLAPGWDPGDDEPQPKGTLMAFDLKDKEAKPFLKGVSGFDLALDGEKIAVMKGPGELYVLDAGSAPGDDLSDAQVALDNLVIELDPREEWRQIFFEGWRNMRDFYWDPGMGGIDWVAIRDQYATLLPRLATRGDLVDLMAETIGELSTSHTYVWGGDRGVSVPRRATGLLGARLVREGTAFRVAEIYHGDPADRVRSPLQEPGVDIKPDDYILAVNHTPLAANEPFEASLENLADKEVLLTVNRSLALDGAREVVVTPMGADEESRLRYVDWVRRNREYVAEKTDGKIGYLHLPDMMGNGLIAFDTWFYPQLDKEGMVVDARYNQGGFVSPLIFSRFARHLLWWDRARGGSIWTYPNRVLNGPFVVLTNEHAGSDGDIFPMAIQVARLAPVIGKRSWGGVVGIRGGRPLVDGGVLTQPEFAWWHPQQGWSLENRGVLPDIEVEELPQEAARGIDAQLDRGITEVLRLREEHPPLKPQFAPVPDRSRAAFSGEH